MEKLRCLNSRFQILDTRYFQGAAARRGQSLVEVLVAAAVGALLVIAAAGVIAPALKANTTAGKAQVAAALGKELSDNIHVWSEGDWHNVLNLATSSANTYYLSTTSSPFIVVTGTESVTVATTTYTRFFYIDDVQRNSAGAVVASGGSNDPSTKQITEVYNWPQGNTTTFSFYLSRYRNNVVGQTDWSGGSGQSTPVTSTENIFASSTAIKFLTPGSIRVVLNSTGTLASWLTNTALPSDLQYHSSVLNNGYIYTIGGYYNINFYSTSSVFYAQVNTSTGAVGSWAATTALPGKLAYHSSVVYNGYVYTTGGEFNQGNATKTTFYAPINADGTVGSWAATTALSYAPVNHSAVVNNGYIYVTGGSIPSAGAATSTVVYATINSSGTLGSWTATTALPSSTQQHSAVVYNNYIYVTGGLAASGFATSTVLYAQINTSTGAVGSWAATTALPSAINSHSAAVNNGYMYVIGGTNMNGSVYYAQINSDGTVGSWSTTSVLPDDLSRFSSVVYNGYIYTTGGLSGDSTSTVFYAPIN